VITVEDIIMDSINYMWVLFRRQMDLFTIYNELFTSNALETAE
jgi:hypothetical protein